jgi:GNAT superfamily N-acetyltransferase
MDIIEAQIEHIDLIVPLFDAYRVFYRTTPDPERVREFLTDRISNGESVIFLAMVDNTAVGFTQLYFSFSSVSMQGTFILNDLYVRQDYRKQGIGEALLNKAKELCRTRNYKGVGLETETDNPAQYLYERMGWIKDNYLHYFWTNAAFK